MTVKASLRGAVGAMAVLAMTTGIAAAHSTHPEPIEGTLAEVHGHEHDGTKVAEGYALATPDENLPVSPEQDATLIGSPVVVDDEAPDAGFQGAAAPTTGAPRLQTAGVPTAGARTVLVLMVTTPDHPTLTPTVEAERATFFTGPNSVSNYLSTHTDGQTRLTGIRRPDGDVYGPIALTTPMPTCTTSDVFAIGRAADAAVLAQHGVSAADYDHVAYVLPSGAPCGWAGLATMPGRNLWLKNTASTSIAAHELVHNLGSHHASTLSCTSAGTRVTLASTCNASEYGDPFDVMGNSGRLMSGVNRIVAGLIDIDRVTTLSHSQTVTLTSASAFPAAGTQTVLIPRVVMGSTAVEHFALEIRSPRAPFDAFAAGDPVTKGVSIRKVGAVTWSQQTQLLDTTPATTTFTDAALLPGATFTDPASGVSITTDSVTPGSATVTVTMPDLRDGTPPATPSISAYRRADGAVSVYWSGAATGERVDRYALTRNGQPLITQPRTGFTDTSAAARQAVSYEVQAIDIEGNRSATGASVTLAPFGAAGDTSPPQPVKTFTATAVGLAADLSWEAARDDRGVVRYELRRNGAVVAEPTGLRFIDTAPAGTHDYQLRAVDAAGNKSAPVQATVTLVDPSPPPPPSTATPPAQPPAPATPPAPAVIPPTQAAPAPADRVVPPAPAPAAGSTAPGNAATAPPVRRTTTRVTSRVTSVNGARRRVVDVTAPGARGMRAVVSGRAVQTRGATLRIVAPLSLTSVTLRVTAADGSVTTVTVRVPRGVPA